MKDEGFVVVDGEHKRIKIKSPASATTEGGNRKWTWENEQTRPLYPFHTGC